MTNNQIDKLLSYVANDPVDIMNALVDIGLTPEEIEEYWFKEALLHDRS